MNKKIYIRTDANSIIASGHLMRCLCIAEAITAIGDEVCFIFSDNYPERIMKNYHYQYLVLNSEWDNLEEELDKMLEVIKKYAVESLLVDSYFVTQHYLKCLDDVTNTYYIDDMQKTFYQVSGVISYAMGAKSALYEKWYKNTKTKIYYGLQYVPLRKEFFDKQAFHVTEVPSKVLITLGGADEYNITYSVLKGILQERLEYIQEIHVVIGKYFQHLDSLKLLQKKSNKIVFHENCSNMSTLMTMCDYAIAAAGTTLYEMGACGTPTICLTIAENQEKTAKLLGDEGAVLYAGNYCKNPEETIENVIVCIRMMKEYYMRKKLSAQIHTYTDGKGAMRIADILHNDLKKD